MRTPTQLPLFRAREDKDNIFYCLDKVLESVTKLWHGSWTARSHFGNGVGYEISKKPTRRRGVNEDVSSGNEQDYSAPLSVIVCGKTFYSVTAMLDWLTRIPAGEGRVDVWVIHDERKTRNRHKQAALVGRGGSLVYGTEARRHSHCENIQYQDSMKFRKRLPNTNTKSRPNTLLTLFIAPAGPDPDTVCTVMECPALKVNRAISMIVWHVAGAMKRHLTPEAGFCYQGKQTTVPHPFHPA